ncbi:MAG: hypothetical protein DME51_09035, partial [Verrucomicrobia bacterium]
LAFTLSFGKFWWAWQKSYGRRQTARIRLRRSFSLRAKATAGQDGVTAWRGGRGSGSALQKQSFLAASPRVTQPSETFADRPAY